TGHHRRRARLLRDQPDRPPDAVWISRDVVTGDNRLPGVRRGQGREDLDGCGLAGAVGAEQSEDLALADGDGHPVESLDGWLAATRRIRLDQVRGLDGKGGC